MGEQMDAVRQAMTVCINDLQWLVERLQALIARGPLVPPVAGDVLNAHELLVQLSAAQMRVAELEAQVVPS